MDNITLVVNPPEQVDVTLKVEYNTVDGAVAAAAQATSNATQAATTANGAAAKATDAATQATSALQSLNTTIAKQQDDISHIMAGSIGAVPTDSPVANINVYDATAPGTYTNMGGLVVSAADIAAGDVQLTRTVAGTWVKRVIANDLSAYLPKADYNYGGKFATVADANAAITNAVGVNGKNNRDGKRVDIGTNGTYVPYWWNGGFADGNLVEFAIAGIKPWSAQIYKIGAQTSINGYIYEAVTATTAAQVPGAVAETIWKRVVGPTQKTSAVDLPAFEQGDLTAGGVEAASTTRIRTKGAGIRIYAPATLIGTINPGFQFAIKTGSALPVNSALSDASYLNSGGAVTLASTVKYARIIIRKTDLTDILPTDVIGFSLSSTYVANTVNDYDTLKLASHGYNPDETIKTLKDVEIKTGAVEKTVAIDLPVFEQGDLNAGGVEVVSTTRIRSKGPGIRVYAPAKLTGTINTGFQFAFKTGASLPVNSAISDSNFLNTGGSVALASTVKFVRVLIRKTDLTAILPTDVIGFSLISTYTPNVVTDYDAMSLAKHGYSPGETQKTVKDIETATSLGDKALLFDLPLFEQGDLQLSGNEVTSTTVIRSKGPGMVMNTPVIVTATIDPAYQFAIKTGTAIPVTGAVGTGVGVWRTNGAVFTLDAAVKYARILIKRIDGAVILPTDVTGLVLSGLITEKPFNNSDSLTKTNHGYPAGTPPLTTKSIDDRVKLTEKRVPFFAPTFRTPSQANKGRISIIDDDVKAEAYSELYPFLKARNIPFGVAIITGFLNTAGYMTTDQLFEMRDNGVEMMSHTVNHNNSINLTAAQTDFEFKASRDFLHSIGCPTLSLVLPYGGFTEETLRIASKYYINTYHFSGNTIATTVLGFDNIKNHRLQRFSFNSNMGILKGLIDAAAATNSWLIITTHVKAFAWTDTSFTDLDEIITYAKGKGCEFVLPKDGFQIYGNLIESDNGSRINAKCEILTS